METTSRKARKAQEERKPHAPVAHRLLAVALVVFLGVTASMGRARAGSPSPVFAQSEAAPATAPLPTAPAPAPAPESGALVLQPQRSAQQSDRSSVTDRWWFWAAIGGVVVTTALVLIIANHSGGTPHTDLGNMEAFP